jgi:hypothetical protein
MPFEEVTFDGSKARYNYYVRSSKQSASRLLETTSVDGHCEQGKDRMMLKKDAKQDKTNGQACRNASWHYFLGACAKFHTKVKFFSRPRMKSGRTKTHSLNNMT